MRGTLLAPFFKCDIYCRLHIACNISSSIFFFLLVDFLSYFRGIASIIDTMKLFGTATVITLVIQLSSAQPGAPAVVSSSASLTTHPLTVSTASITSSTGINR